MKKLFHILFTVLFLAACLVPGLGLTLLGPASPGGNETAVPAPALTRPDGSFNVEFLSDAANWFSRSFGFRQELITLDAGLKVGLFRTSPQSLVALGEGDWLYYAETLDDYTGADVLSDRQAYCIARNLRLAQDYAQSQGAGFAFTIAPNKASVYPEHLSLPPAEVEYVSPAVEALRQQEVNYADLFGPLRSVEGEDLYFTLDSHWTNRGAALGHDVLLEALGLPAEDAFGKAGSYQLTHRGDLHEMLYPASSRLDQEFVFGPPLAFTYARPIRDVDDLRIETTSAAENGPLLMFRDSFGNALHSLMAESFSSARFSRAVPYDMGQIGELGAEYVVVEIVERNLPLLADGPFLMLAQELEESPWEGESIPIEDLKLEEVGSVKTESSGQYRKVTATIGIACDTDSPVYLVTFSGTASTTLPLTFWEAQPTCLSEKATSCTAYFPAEAQLERGFYMAFRKDGQWRMARTEEADVLSGEEG